MLFIKFIIHNTLNKNVLFYRALWKQYYLYYLSLVDCLNKKFMFDNCLNKNVVYKIHHS